MGLYVLAEEREVAEVVFAGQLVDGDVRKFQVEPYLLDGMVVDEFQGPPSGLFPDDVREMFGRNTESVGIVCHGAVAAFVGGEHLDEGMEQAIGTAERLGTPMAQGVVGLQDGLVDELEEERCKEVKHLLFGKPVEIFVGTVAYEFQKNRESAADIFRIIVQYGICKGMAEHLPGVLLGRHQTVHHPWCIAEHRRLAVAAVQDAHHRASGLADEDLARRQFAGPFILVEG